MSIEACINTAIEGGIIERSEAQALLDIYRRQLEIEIEGGAGAEARARAVVADELEFEAIERKRKAGLAAKAARDRVSDMASFRTAKGEADLGGGLIAVLEGFRTGFGSVEGRRKFLVSEGQRRMDAVVEKFDRTKLTGASRNKAMQEQVVSELFGQDTGSPEARVLANAWMDTAEWLRQRFNAAGGAIGKLENWGLPQHHDALALISAGKENWKRAIMPALDPARMKHPKSGRPISAGELGAVLDHVWDTVTTQGWSKREPAMRPFGLGALANRHGDHRFLIFKDGRAWLDYQREFGGGGDVFEAMMAHVQIMARDIAAMEVMGPNPEAMLHYLKQNVMQAAALKAAGKPAPIAGKPERAVSRANIAIATADDMWAEMRGALNTPVASGPANFAANLRNVIVSATLGRAVISAVTTDPFFQAIARKAAGVSVMRLPADLARSLTQHGRMEAMRQNLMLDSALNVFSTQARYLEGLHGSRWSRYLADRVLQLSGLTPWTQAARHAFGLGFQATAADMAGRPWAQLEPAFRDTLSGYGIDAAMWDRLRHERLYEPEDGAKFLRPKEALESDDPLVREAGERYVEAMLAETEFAVPSSTVRGRAWLVGGKRPGTFWGEMIRSGAMFKNFSVTILLLQGARIHRMLANSPARGAAYAGSLLATTTMGGALALWLKDIAGGRDPRPIGKNPSAFVLQSMLQGGGLGLFGDFIVADRNRYGGGLGPALTGPAIETGNDFLNLTVGNAIEAMQGKDTHFGREAVRFGGRLVPGSSTWYLGLAYQRVFLDQLQYLADPAANKSFKARQKYWKGNFGNDHWWRPGEVTPDRAPAL